MTRVCLVGEDDTTLEYELLSRETAREALATYDLHEPFANAVGLETVSLGAAVALLNDLDWYLARFVTEALVLEPSVDDEEWLSREMATAIRDDEIDPAESDRFLKVYGLEPQDHGGDGSQGGTEDDAPFDAGETPGDDGDRTGRDERPPRLVEPMYVTRTGGSIPEYDLRPVEETLLVRVTESEFGA